MSLNNIIVNNVTCKTNYTHIQTYWGKTESPGDQKAVGSVQGGNGWDDGLF